MKEKTKIEATIIETLVEAGIEALKNLLNVETDENGKLKSFKLIKEGNKGTVYEFEVKVHTESNASENDKEKHKDKDKEKGKDKK